MQVGKESDLTLNSFLIPRKRVLLGKIRLKPNIIETNYYACVFHNIVLGFLLGSIQLLQRKLLEDPEYYNLSHDDALKNNVFILIADLSSRLILFPICGILIDKYGRQTMNFIAYLCIAVGIAFFPFPFFILKTPNVFPWLYVGRIIYAAGTSLLVTMPFIGDYVENECKGRAMGVNTIALGLGIAIAGILVDVTQRVPLTLTKSFAGVIVITLLLGLGYSLLLKKGVTYYQAFANQIPTASDPKGKFKVHYKKMIQKALKERPWISTGFIFSFLCGMNLGIISLHHYIINPAEFTRIFLKSEDLQTLQYSFLAAVVVNATLEILLDRIKTLYIALVVFFFGIISYSIIGNISNTPSAILLILIAICFISCLGCFSLLNYLEHKHCPRLIRGHSYGIKMFCLVLGMLVTVVICGLTNGIFNSYTNNNLILYVMLGFMILGFFIFGFMYIKYIKQLEMLVARKQGPEIKTWIFNNGSMKPDYERHLLDQLDESQLRNSELAPHQGVNKSPKKN